MGRAAQVAGDAASDVCWHVKAQRVSDVENIQLMVWYKRQGARKRLQQTRGMLPGACRAMPAWLEPALRKQQGPGHTALGLLACACLHAHVGMAGGGCWDTARMWLTMITWAAFLGYAMLALEMVDMTIAC
jgi:hypothetical protein